MRSNNRRVHKPQGLRKKIKTVTIRHAAAVWPDYVLPGVPMLQDAGRMTKTGMDSPRFLPTIFCAVFLPRDRATLDFKRGRYLRIIRIKMPASCLRGRRSIRQSLSFSLFHFTLPICFSPLLFVSRSSVFLLPSSTFSLRLLMGAPFRLASRHHHSRRIASFFVSFAFLFFSSGASWLR